ncbi:myrosinase 1-like isoform X2 [Venturia canescens]|nr:myrosinase 1-like isoform X2 [Venturia canescens]
MKFPADFKLGISTASYQIEGAWNVSDKGESVWDRFTHQRPSPIRDASDGDVACDSYNKYKEDIEILKDLGVDGYRISLSWTRILPGGFPNKVSEDGIRYYKNLLENLKAQGIEPVVCIYHWDHPVVLEEMGGWTNELMVTWFADYARVVFNHLGDHIKTYVTLNEVADNCKQAYGSGDKAPGKTMPEIAPYLCVHNMLKAHAKVYHMYADEYRSQQNGIIGIVLQCMSYYPKYQNDTETPEVFFDFNCGWMLDPLFSENGGYPAVMKERIGENSKLEGYPKSRLPEFTEEEIDYIRGSADFIGLNHYTSVLTEPALKSNDETLWYQDHGVIRSYNESWPRTASSWLRVVPQGFGDLLRKLKNRYNNPAVYVLENGIADLGTSLQDTERIQYLHDYIREMLLAINRDNCNVKTYFIWSLLDNFEWESGYSERFGLVNIDFNNFNRSRTPKLSYNWYKQLISTRQLSPIENLKSSNTTYSVHVLH